MVSTGRVVDQATRLPGHSPPLSAALSPVRLFFQLFGVGRCAGSLHFLYRILTHLETTLPVRRNIEPHNFHVQHLRSSSLLLRAVS